VHLTDLSRPSRLLGAFGVVLAAAVLLTGTQPAQAAAPGPGASAVPSAGSTAPPSGISGDLGSPNRPYVTQPSDSAPIPLVIALKPSNRDALHQLAGKRAANTRKDREAAVARTAPTASARTQTRAAVIAAGFTVTEETAWDLRVTATPSQAERTFGMKLTGSGSSRHPDRTITIPAAWTQVSAVIGLDQRPIMKPHTTPFTPSELAGAYDVSSTAKGAGATVATVQFSGWNPADLTQFASQYNLGPLQSGQLTQVSVDGANPGFADGQGGDVEVALDQEMVLAGAPQAKQRAYFAPNSLLGMYDVYGAIADDVGQFGITAVTSSWGSCETFVHNVGSTPGDFQAAVTDIISRAVAAGATTFAASGDQGQFDCANPDNPNDLYATYTDVDFPAAASQVVGVGGTHLTRPNPSNWTESAWAYAGGGVSRFTPHPAYQSGSGGRSVPDISAVADTDPGISIVARGQTGHVGGTSAAAPLVAAQFAAAIADRGCGAGIGDIHSVLYTAAGTPGNFRDPLPVNYDTKTGLGTPQWQDPHLARLLVPSEGVCPLIIKTAYTQVFDHVTVGVSFTKTLVASGGTAPYTWNITSGALPSGLSLNALTGTISGIPTLATPSAGATFYVTVTDNAASPVTTDPAMFNIAVEPMTGRFIPLATKRIFSQVVGTSNVAVDPSLKVSIPGATAIVVNVEVYQPSTSGYVRITPYGSTSSVATQEFVKGRSISNLATVALNTTNHQAQVKVSAGSALILIDIAGYYVNAAGSVFNPLPTTRVFAKTVGTAPVKIDLTAYLPKINGVTVDPSAAVMNVEVFAPTANSYLRVTPSGVDPAVATQEFLRGETISNLVFVQLHNRAAQVKVAAGTAQVFIDIAGYFSSDPGSSFVPVSNTRVFNSQVGTTNVSLQDQWIGSDDLSSDLFFAKAVVLNVQVYAPTTSGYLRVTPVQWDAPVATQEFAPGQTISNLVVVALTGGDAQLKVSAGSARVFVDIAGYYY